jgi:hypothetical protein
VIREGGEIREGGDEGDDDDNKKAFVEQYRVML